MRPNVRKVCPICAMPTGVPPDRAYLLGYATATRTQRDFRAAGGISAPEAVLAAFRGTLCGDHAMFLAAVAEGQFR